MKVKYIDKRKIYIPQNVLSKYPGGIALPNSENIIEVTEGEFRSLCKIKNGSYACFEEVKQSRRNYTEESVKEDI